MIQKSQDTQSHRQRRCRQNRHCHGSPHHKAWRHQNLRMAWWNPQFLDKNHHVCWLNDQIILFFLGEIMYTNLICLLVKSLKSQWLVSTSFCILGWITNFHVVAKAFLQKFVQMLVEYPAWHNASVDSLDEFPLKYRGWGDGPNFIWAIHSYSTYSSGFVWK